MADRNPFDDFDNVVDEPGEAVLRPGPAPSLWESMKENFKFVSPFNQSSDAFLNAPRQLADARIVKKVEERTGVAQPGDDPLLGKPSQQEYDAARYRLEAAKREKERSDAFESPTMAGKALGFVGGLAGGLVDPTNIVSAGGLIARGGGTFLGKLGMGGTGARIAGVGLEAGAVNAALDVPTQAMRIGAGIEQEYDPLRTAMAFGFGQVAGSGMAGVQHLVQTRRQTAAQELQDVQARMAEGRPPEPEATAPRELTIEVPVPGADSAKIPPEVLPRVIEAAKQGTETDGGLVQLKLSPEDRDALRTAGYPVSDENTVPKSVIADLARREATGPVEVTARGDAPAQTTTPATTSQSRETSVFPVPGTNNMIAFGNAKVEVVENYGWGGIGFTSPEGKSTLFYSDERGAKFGWRRGEAPVSQMDQYGVPKLLQPIFRDYIEGRIRAEDRDAVVARLRAVESQIETPATARPNETTTPSDISGQVAPGNGEAATTVAPVRGPGQTGPDAGGTATQAGRVLPMDSGGEAPRLGTNVPAIAPHRVVTATGREIDVAPIVVEAANLRTSADSGYDPTLQPRDRDRAASQAQIREMSSRLDPERLGQSAEADRGAPIVGPDGMVESGNGRMLAIRSAYQQGGEAAARYREWIAQQGVDVSGFTEPVLVRQRLTPLTQQDRQAFTLEANQSATLFMSAGERAMADARSLNPETLALIRNSDDLGAIQNRDFVREFVRGLPQTEQGMMATADGSLSAEGLSRVRNAVLAKAYGDATLLARVAEATTDDIKSISNALISAAPEWAKFRSDVQSGLVRADMDLTPELMEAIKRTADLRAKGTKFDVFLAQQDAFDRLSAPVEAWMRMFYDGKGKRAAGGPAIAERLKFYAQEARKVSADDGLAFDLPPVRAQDVQVLAAKKAADDAAGKNQTNLFERGGAGDGPGGAQGRTEAGGRAAGEGGQVSGRRSDGGSEGRQGQPTGTTGEGDSLKPQAKRNNAPPVNPSPDARFPNRQQLQGEGGPRALPENATPEQIASFRITEEMRQIAEALGRKLETDGRFTLKGGVLGEYKPKEGVLRIRQDGDVQVFNHELGHAVDQRLRNGAATSADMRAAIARNGAELKSLDANNTDPAKQDPAEGVAEYIRMYLDNPGYGRNLAPNFADDFDAVLAKDPDLKAIMDRAAMVTQIDSGMDPMQRMSSMISPAEDARGLRQFQQERKRYGVPYTMALWFDRFYANVVGKDRYIDRMVRLLDEAHFEKTGQPLPRRFADDPYKLWRMLPGAKQSAIDSIYNGVREYGKVLEGPKSASLRDAMSIALNGNLGRMENIDDPLVKDFEGYLVARRSRNLYERWHAKELRNPPVRASENEIMAAIPAYEAKYPQFKEAADKVFSFANAMWKKKYDAGLITKDVYEAVMAKGGEYVPFFRDMQGDDVAGSGGGTPGSGVQGKAIKGSTRNILGPIRSLMYDAAQAERIIAMNDTFKSMVRLAESGGEFSGRYIERIPNTELKAVTIDLAEAMKNAAKQSGIDPASADGIIRSMEQLVGDDLSATVFRATEIAPTGERIFFVWENGERAAYKVGNDPFSKNFFETVSSMSAPERDIMLATFGKMNAMFSQFITNAPQFALKNLIMDNMSRIFIARDTGILGRIPGGSIAVGLYTQLFDKEFAKSYAAMGGIRGGVASAAQRDLQNQQAGKVISMSPRTLQEWASDAASLITDPKRFAVQVAKSPIHALELVVKAIEATETMGRLGQAKIVQRHLEKNGVPKADAAFGATFEARDILDYDRRGFATVGATRFMPFLNVGFQGMAHANEVLMGAPLQAALQAYRRGGYANLDGNQKAMLQEAVKAWGMIAAGAAITASYAYYMADDPSYQAQSEYMRRRYYIFPAGQDESGRQKIVTVPKPFDAPGAVFSAIEGFIYGQRRADGKTWERVSKALEDVGIPRQMSSVEGFLGAMPMLKTAYEATTGTKLGFEGSPSFPIVPQSLKALPPDMQYTATTSWFAKKLGETMDWSPMVVDHVMNGMGGTTVRDANYALTAFVGDNPNITTKDAMNRTFFGALYRDAPGGGTFRSDLMSLMARDNGKYVRLANGYSTSRDEGDSDSAEEYYKAGNDTAKAMMVLRSSARFRPEDRQLHPLERTATIGDIFSKIARNLSNQEIEIMGGNRRRTKKGEERNIYEVEPAASRAISNILQSLMAEETRNGLAVAGEPGYQSYPIIDTSGRYKAIRAIDEDVANELETRIKAAKVLPIEHIQRRWPELKRRLLTDKQAATVRDLRASP